MTMKFTTILLVLVALTAVQSKVVKRGEYKINEIPSVQAGPSWTRCYIDPNQGGNYQEFYSYVPDLSKYGLDNYISSTCSTGIWLYYENMDYNVQTSAQVAWFHGIQYCGDMSSSFDNMASSIRYAGSSTVLDAESFTLYDGQGFQGAEFYSETSVSDLRNMQGKGESLIITGQTQWTFYTGENYSGISVCAGFTTVDQAGGITMHIGLYPKLASTYTNTIKSVAKGCHSDTFVELVPLKVTTQAENGAMGSFSLEDMQS